MEEKKLFIDFCVMIYLSGGLRQAQKLDNKKYEHRDPIVTSLKVGHMTFEFVDY